MVFNATYLRALNAFNSGVSQRDDSKFDDAIDSFTQAKAKAYEAYRSAKAEHETTNSKELILSIFENIIYAAQMSKKYDLLISTYKDMAADEFGIYDDEKKQEFTKLQTSYEEYKKIFTNLEEVDTSKLTEQNMLLIYHFEVAKNALEIKDIKALHRAITEAKQILTNMSNDQEKDQSSLFIQKLELLYKELKIHSLVEEAKGDDVITAQTKYTEALNEAKQLDSIKNVEIIYLQLAANLAKQNKFAEALKLHEEAREQNCFNASSTMKDEADRQYADLYHNYAKAKIETGILDNIDIAEVKDDILKFHYYKTKVKNNTSVDNIKEAINQVSEEHQDVMKKAVAHLIFLQLERGNNFDLRALVSEGIDPKIIMGLLDNMHRGNGNQKNQVAKTLVDFGFISAGEEFDNSERHVSILHALAGCGDDEFQAGVKLLALNNDWNVDL